jgi:hypothetical protein
MAIFIGRRWTSVSSSDESGTAALCVSDVVMAVSFAVIKLRSVVDTSKVLSCSNIAARILERIAAAYTSNPLSGSKGILHQRPYQRDDAAAAVAHARR